MTPGVHVRQLHKRYGGFAALTDVSFTVRDGEVLGLIGPNGAGKTTLFECIAGVLPADSGTVMVKGQQVHGPDRGAHLFFMPDGIAPWAAQTVAWALDFTVGFFEGDSARLPVVIERLQLEPLMRRSVGTLSKGERKRRSLRAAQRGTRLWRRHARRTDALARGFRRTTRFFVPPCRARWASGPRPTALAISKTT